MESVKNREVKYLLADKKAILTGLDKALIDYKVAALTEKDGRILYDYIENSSEVKLEHGPTVLPPKKFLLPQEEVILNYTDDGQITQEIRAEPLVLFGIRPCDLNGLRILDEAFADSHGDPNYLAKREKTIVIGMECQKVCDKDSFCYKVNSHKIKDGFDLMLYDVGTDFAIKVATAKGEDFCSKYFITRGGGLKESEEFLSKKDAEFAEKKPFKNLANFPEIFEDNKDNSVWEREAHRCLSCGSCIMVCPTCYCFDVADTLALNLKEGQRVRRWDACMLRSFAKVAGNENFRVAKTERLKHRIQRKFNYLMAKHGKAVCVGCGRCVRACLADISPKTIAEVIIGENEEKE